MRKTQGIYSNLEYRTTEIQPLDKLEALETHPNVWVQDYAL